MLSMDMPLAAFDETMTPEGKPGLLIDWDIESGRWWCESGWFGESTEAFCVGVEVAQGSSEDAERGGVDGVDGEADEEEEMSVASKEAALPFRAPSSLLCCETLAAILPTDAATEVLDAMDGDDVCDDEGVELALLKARKALLAVA